MTLIIEEGGSQSADPPKRRHAANTLVRKFSSLQVSHYPVLLFSNTAAEEQPPSVVWKTSSNTDPDETDPNSLDLDDSTTKPPRK
ncbi:hypothetical protein Q1695_008412 [Nippostrongylus brasiliensis]|nr:hypothetical protein Q1695_008412 [Nippostrongylus brasiliensis]